MFCFCIRTLPSPTCCFHRRTPRVRSTHQRYSSRPSATLRKMRSPQTIGVDPDHAGSSSFHVMFSVFDQRTGRFFSPLRPFADGPRHCGQFSADGAAAVAQSRIVVSTLRISTSSPQIELHEHAKTSCFLVFRGFVVSWFRGFVVSCFQYVQPVARLKYSRRGSHL